VRVRVRGRESEREDCRRDLQCLLTSKVFDAMSAEEEGEWWCLYGGVRREELAAYGRPASKQASKQEEGRP
jgi:hypothetical protein